MNVILTPELEAFIHACVKTGRYATTSDVIRKALDLLRQEERIHGLKLTEIRHHLHAGADHVFRGGEHGEHPAPKPHSEAEELKASTRELLAHRLKRQ